MQKKGNLLIFVKRVNNDELRMLRLYLVHRHDRLQEAFDWCWWKKQKNAESCGLGRQGCKAPISVR
jgi:hypothetical protein